MGASFKLFEVDTNDTDIRAIDGKPCICIYAIYLYCYSVYVLYLEKISKTTATKKIILADKAKFSFDFGLILTICIVVTP